MFKDTNLSGCSDKWRLWSVEGDIFVAYVKWLFCRWIFFFDDFFFLTRIVVDWPGIFKKKNFLISNITHELTTCGCSFIVLCNVRPLEDIFLTEAAMILGLVKKFVDKLAVMLDYHSIASDVEKSYKIISETSCESFSSKQSHRRISERDLIPPRTAITQAQHRTPTASTTRNLANWNKKH